MLREIFRRHCCYSEKWFGDHLYFYLIFLFNLFNLFNLFINFLFNLFNLFKFIYFIYIFIIFIIFILLYFNILKFKTLRYDKFLDFSRARR